MFDSVSESLTGLCYPNTDILPINHTKLNNRVFHSSDNTQQLYEGVAVPIIQSAVQGYNGTIFAYGQTASGKTYTMMGNEDSVGIIPKAIQHVFKIPDREFLLRVSYMEIYNETITDLLCDIRKKKPLGIREDVNRNTYVEDLIEEVVVAPEQVMEWIRKGEKNRHYGETKMNEHSSRSHTIFRMIIESRERSDPANANCDGAVMVSHLVSCTPRSVRLKEGCNINRSLFILGQVIKKLCDDPSGFINYRDSKLTRILQNSLGGNAKTVIICTITPVSFDETLSTLQFANTAKRMKNTPKVNEVLDDDALLKRYRKEILDLKKQLEEVSSKTQIHAMEKDQLAQLLEEKNTLQKVQEDRIRNLTEMLVTSASFSSKQNAKAKRRRRVTWAPGKINQASVSYFEDFEKPRLTETKKMKMSLSLSEDSNFNNLVLENEQLKLEINEMKEKLKEKIEMDEFEALEKQTQKDHEIQLMHEITNLKSLVSNAEVYNEELEVSLYFRAFLTIYLPFFQGDSDKLIEEIQQLNKSLLDSETIALDAKKESAFLRTENLELKEKMNELLNNCKQMQKDVQLYQSQIEAGKASYKKMQADLQKELQSVFQENTRLISLMDGKVPKDLCSLVELEKKAADLKGELEKAWKENALLQKQVNELSEFQSLPNTVEMQQKEILEKCEELRLLKLEREKLLSEVADNEIKFKHMTEEIGKSKDNLADAQLKYVKFDQEYVALKQLHEELEKKYVAASENNEQMKLQINILSKEAQESKTTLDEVKLEVSVSLLLFFPHSELDISHPFKANIRFSENMYVMQFCITIEVFGLFLYKLKLSSKMKELEEKTAEHKQLLEIREDFIQTQQKLNEMEQLKEQEKIMELRLEAKDSEIQAVLQQLTECREEVKTLLQERDHLKQKEESLQAETDQLKEDIKDTNILAHEELRNTQSSLKQYQNTVEKLEKNISEKESQILSVEEALGKTIQELNIRVKRYVIIQNKNAFNIPQIQEKSMEQELFLLREELNQAQRKLHEMEEVKANERQKESEKMERTDFIPKLHDCQEVSTLTERGDDNLKMQLENLQNERDQLRKTIQETIKMREELRCAHYSLGQHQETIVELKESISEKEDQLLKAQEALKETTDELQQKVRCTYSLIHPVLLQQFLFSRVCSKKREYYSTVNKYEMELLEEKRKQDQLQDQIQCLRKIYWNQNEVSSQELNISEVLQSLHFENILKDVSEMESQLLCIETELQQEESARKETTQFWEACSGTHCDTEKLKEELKKDTERLLQVIKFWTPNVKILLQLSSELDAKTTNYCKNADAESKQRKEKSEELLQELSTLKEQLAPGGSASLALEEENYRLHNKLKAAEQDIKVPIFISKEDFSACLLSEIKIQSKQPLSLLLSNKPFFFYFQAKLDKGAELYKEEIDHLKTHLVKYDMERMKQSKSFEMKLANYKALAEHQEQQLRKLKEELRRSQQDQNVTVVLEEKAPQQSQIPLTCGGGSGIVQSTQILVLKSEQAKLQKENLHLKKQNDLLLSNELQLKEELRKWKERALKWRERFSRETTREAAPRSPRKTVSYSLKDQMPSPSKQPISQETVIQDLSKPLPLTCPTNFFDNSSLGTLTDTRPAGIEPTEEHLKHWFGTSEKDKAPDCTTQ
uniref:Centromere protein E n=1 Tax=Strix occidentalis caurina TaxID=311401 RepID=A0A8D0FTF3_STROC